MKKEDRRITISLLKEIFEDAKYDGRSVKFYELNGKLKMKHKSYFKIIYIFFIGVYYHIRMMLAYNKYQDCFDKDIRDKISKILNK